MGAGPTTLAWGHRRRGRSKTGAAKGRSDGQKKGNRFQIVRIKLRIILGMSSPVHHELGERRMRYGPKGTRAYARKPYCDAWGDMVPALFPDEEEMDFAEQPNAPIQEMTVRCRILMPHFQRAAEYRRLYQGQGTFQFAPEVDMTPPTRGRGRPRKTGSTREGLGPIRMEDSVPTRKRGRPRKIPSIDAESLRSITGVCLVSFEAPVRLSHAESWREGVVIHCKGGPHPRNWGRAYQGRRLHRKQQEKGRNGPLELCRTISGNVDGKEGNAPETHGTSNGTHGDVGKVDMCVLNPAPRNPGRKWGRGGCFNCVEGEFKQLRVSGQDQINQKVLVPRCSGVLEVRNGGNGNSDIRAGGKCLAGNTTPRRAGNAGEGGSDARRRRCLHQCITSSEKDACAMDQKGQGRTPASPIVTLG
ncbi:hypothetical protein YC2023_067259 [Brassica napus]